MHFKIIATVSLPYDAFKPFTSTKTCILYAQKRTAKQVASIQNEYNRIVSCNKAVSPSDCLRQVFINLELANEKIFMAEPGSVGYKRRKGLPDLVTPNELYSEGEELNVSTVLFHFKNQNCIKPDSKLGFHTTIEKVLSRETIRLDPKYRWLWDYQKGVVWGQEDTAIPLSKYFRLISLSKLKAGELDTETRLVDLDSVSARSGEISGDYTEVTTIQSDKVQFVGADILISKLEPYLGKVIIDPPQDAIGTTEWVGIECRRGIDHRVAGYFLMLPQMCEAYRKLQSGKRHARMEPEELLELKVGCEIEKIPPEKIADLDSEISKGKTTLKSLRNRIDSIITDS